MLDLEKEPIFEKKESISQKPQIDTKNLLNTLAAEIAKKYGLDINQVKKLIQSKTWSKLDSLKSMVGSSGESIDVAEFKNVIAGAKDVIEKASKDEIELLKWTIEKTKLNPEKDIYLSNKFISSSLIERAQNPQNLWDNIIGAGIWILNSTEKFVALLYNIWAGIGKTPYHIYLLVSWKADYDWFKNI